MKTKISILLIAILMAAPKAFAQEEVPSYDWAQFGAYAAQNEAAGDCRPLAVIMGDSITAGWAAMDPDFFKENNILGRGISGQVTSQMLVRFRRDVLDHSPKCVVIIGGINDIARNAGYISLDNILGNIASMCELAVAHGIIPVLATVVPADHIGWRPAITGTREEVASLSAKIREYAAASGIGLIDLEVIMADENGAPRTDLSPDTIHPSYSGYKVIESALLNILNQHKNL